LNAGKGREGWSAGPKNQLSMKLKETKNQTKKVWEEEFRVFARVFQSLMVPLML
jgi:hypothetical protein